MVALSGDEARGTWQQLEVMTKHWRAIDDRAGQAGPFIYTTTHRTLKADGQPEDEKADGE